jgi:DedD protein
MEKQRMDSDDSDITLGPGKLLGLFFMLVAVCGVFFAIGYSLGKTSAREQAVNDKTSLSASLSAPAVPESSVAKPSAVVSAKADPQSGSSDDPSAAKSGPDITFYNAVKKDDHGSQPADSAVGSPAAKTPQQIQTVDTASVKTPAPLVANAAKPAPEATADSKPVVPVAGGAFVVQIAAVSREEDAAALAGALRKKSYSVFVVNNPAVHDKLYHVQVGPFTTLQDAEAMRLKLTGEGYNPIVKRT